MLSFIELGRVYFSESRVVDMINCFNNLLPILSPWRSKSGTWFWAFWISEPTGPLLWTVVVWPSFSWMKSAPGWWLISDFGSRFISPSGIIPSACVSKPETAYQMLALSIVLISVYNTRLNVIFY
jgi:hypothetical protein